MAQFDQSADADDALEGQESDASDDEDEDEDEDDDDDMDSATALPSKPVKKTVVKF